MAAKDTVMMVQVRVKNKDLLMTEKDYAKLVDFTAGAFKGYANAMANSVNQIVKTHDRYIDAAECRTSYLRALSQFIVVKVGNITYPSDALRGKAVTAVSKFQSASRSGKMDAIKNTLPAAEEMLNAYRDDMDRFLREMAMSARTTGIVLQVSSAAGFVVLGAMASSILISAGLTATAAAAVSAGTVKIIEGEINLLGKVMLGEKKINPFEEIWKIQVDGTVAMATGAIGSKLDSKIVGNIVKRVSSTVAGKISGKAFKANVVAPMLEKFLNGSGKDLGTSVLESVCNSVGKSLKEGKPPSYKDFESAFDSMLIAGLTGGFIRNLSDYQAGVASSLTKKMMNDVIPDRVLKTLGKKEFDKKTLEKLYGDVNKAIFGKALEVADSHVISTADGSVAGKTLIAEGIDEAAKDKSLQKFIDTEIVKVAKKMKL
jgi:hypothetical protein